MIRGQVSSGRRMRCYSILLRRNQVSPKDIPKVRLMQFSETVFLLYAGNVLRVYFNDQ